MTTSSQHPDAPKMPIAFLIMLGFGIALLIALPGLGLFQQASSAPSSWMLFLGRFHPMILHLPIGLLMFALLLQAIEWLPCKRCSPWLSPQATTFTVGVGAASACLAILSGWLLSHEQGYEKNALNQHLLGGVATGIGALLTLMLRIVSHAQPANTLIRSASRYLLVITNAILVLAAHHGASITHGKNYLFEHAPELIQNIFGMPAADKKTDKRDVSSKETEVYKALIQPILTDRCVGCHSPEKLKGELRLDEYAMVMKGGAGGPVVVAGKPEESKLIRVMQLPLSDDDHMPPEGKPQPTKDEIVLLSWWIKSGAPTNAALETLSLPEQARQRIETHKKN